MKILTTPSDSSAAVTPSPVSRDQLIAQAKAALEAKDIRKAESLLMHALERDPRDLEALRGLAGVRDALGDEEGAIDALKRLIKRAPEPLPFIDELAAYGMPRGRLVPAIMAYERYLQSRPSDARAHYNYAWYVSKTGQFEAALRHFARAIELGVERPEEAHLNRANLYADSLRDDASARHELNRALELNPRFAPALYNLGNLSEQQGDRTAAKDFFARALELEPTSGSALARLADAAEHRSHDETSQALIERMQAAVVTQAHPDLEMALGRALEQRGQTADAWPHYARANEIDRNNLPPYAPARFSEAMDHIIRVCTPEWLSRLSTQETEAPIFICGMFRSGSTLLEQMLAAHPAFKPAGEREFFVRLVAANMPGYPRSLDQLPPEATRTWARAYLQESRKLFGSDKRLTDKRPDNVFFLGVIKALFPKAKFLITERDWRDIAVSVYTTRLGPAANYAADLGHIRHHIREQRRLVDHWRTLFGEDLLTVSYESLIAQPRETLAPVLEALGERWDERCLDFHELRNAVRTASVWQVRQPLNSGSVGRWQRFSAQLEKEWGDFGDTP